jgi:RNase P/RNase MRP subunit p30
MKNKACCVIKETNFEKIRTQIKKQREANPNKKILFVSKDDKLSRKILEKTSINILVILQAHRKDRQKQRDSGLNQVLVKIAKKKAIQIGICLDEIITAKSKEKSDILARVMQNINLCKKAKVQMQFCGCENPRNIYDKKSLGLVLGMPTWMTKNLF